jgi:hypothetical protein
MQKNVVTSMVLGALLLIGRTALAADTVADNVRKSCSKELSTFCKGVPEGEGRILACLYAFEAKVSDKCVQAVYDAAVQLEQAVTAVKFAANECKADLQKYCADVKLGEGRGLACLNKHDKDVSQTCKDALKATGIRK